MSPEWVETGWCNGQPGLLKRTTVNKAMAFVPYMTILNLAETAVTETHWSASITASAT